MKGFHFLLAVIILLVYSCSKDSPTDTTNNSTAGIGGSLAKFTIAQNYLYVVDRSNLYSYNLSDPVNPVLTNSLFVEGRVETIFPYKDKLFIGSAGGMYIYSIINPGTPAKLGTALHVRSCDPVVANDTVAFVTLSGGSRCGPVTDGLYIHDIKNILQPVLKKTLPIPTPFGLGLKDTVLYVCCRQEGLKVFNIKNAYDPVLKKIIKSETYMDVIPYGNLLICYVSAGILLFDISSPENPQLLKKVNN
jgi:hypothetical protein